MDTETAIQEDATQETQTEVQNNPRMDAMEEIAAKREQELRKELGEEEVVEEQQEEMQEEKPAEEPKYHVKIDGEEKEIPLTELLRGYQKDSAASRRLEEAARRQKELDEREAALKEAEARLTNPPEPKAPEVDPSEFLDALYDGDREKAAKLFNDLYSGRKEATQEVKPVDPAEVAALVKQQIAVEGAFETLKRDYQDVLGDPYLVKVADQFLADELANGTPEADAIVKAGQLTRDWVQKFAPKPAEPSRTEKLHRKEGMTRMPTATAARSGTQQPIDEDAYRKDALSDLVNKRRLRG